jgi:Acyl-CoA dehydrogenase, C-terminal domain
MHAAGKSVDVDTAPPEPDLTPDELLRRATAMRLTWEAVELMFRTAGTSSARKSAPLGRYFRNLAVVRTHLTLQSDHTAGNAARLHFGFPPLSRL